MKLNRNFPVLFTACMALASPATADTVTKGLEQTARDVGNDVVGLLNAFGSGKLKPDNIELLSDSKVALSFNGQRFNNPCGIEIFWGDGSSEKFRVEKDAYKTGFTLEHQYDTPRDYKIEINGKVIFRGLKTVVQCPGNYEGTIALAKQAPTTSTQPSQDQTTQAPSLQSDETLANAEKIRVLEAEVAKKQAERIAELEAQLEAQAKDEKIKKLEKELAEKQAKRIAELQAQLNHTDGRTSESTSQDKAIEGQNQPSAVEKAETNSAYKLTKKKAESTDQQKNVEATLSTIQTVPMPSLKGKRVSASSEGDWSHELWCDSRFGKRDRYKSLWKYQGQPVKVDKFKAKGKCRALVKPDFVMTNLLRTAQQFPSGPKITGYCDAHLSRVYFKSLASEVGQRLSTSTFFKPEMSLLINDNVPSQEQIPKLITYHKYVNECFNNAAEATIGKLKGRERQIGEKLHRNLRNAMASNFLQLIKKKITYGEAAEQILSATLKFEGVAQDQIHKIEQERTAAKIQARREYQANQRKIMDDLSRDTQKALQGFGQGVREAFSQDDGFSTFKSNRRRECRLEGKLYYNGRCN